MVRSYLLLNWKCNLYFLCTLQCPMYCIYLTYSTQVYAILRLTVNTEYKQLNNMVKMTKAYNFNLAQLHMLVHSHFLYLNRQYHYLHFICTLFFTSLNLCVFTCMWWHLWIVGYDMCTHVYVLCTIVVCTPFNSLSLNSIYTFSNFVAHFKISIASWLFLESCIFPPCHTEKHPF